MRYTYENNYFNDTDINGMLRNGNNRIIPSNEKVDKKRKFVYNNNGVWDAASLKKEIAALTKRMKKAAENLEFEEAAEIRDTINKMQDDLLLLE